MFSNIFAYLDRLFAVVQPRKLMYMAVDGVAPRAKMNQQRSRRFCAARDREEIQQIDDDIRTELKAKGMKVPPKKPISWDHNVITPGTGATQASRRPLLLAPGTAGGVEALSRPARMPAHHPPCARIHDQAVLRPPLLRSRPHDPLRRLAQRSRHPLRRLRARRGAGRACCHCCRLPRPQPLLAPPLCLALGSGRAQDHQVHSAPAHTGGLRPQPAAHHPRAGRRPHHACPGHARAALHGAAGARVRRQTQVEAAAARSCARGLGRRLGWRRRPSRPSHARAHSHLHEEAPPVPPHPHLARVSGGRV